MSTSRDQVEAACHPTSTSSFTFSRAVPADAQAQALAPLVLDVALEPSSKYFWAVCAQHSNSTTCSRVHSFLTGVLPGADWGAPWIMGTTGTFPSPCARCMAPYHSWCAKNESGPPCGFQGVMVRSPELQVPAGVIVSAVVHVTALGMYELMLNGVKVGDAVLDPGFSTNVSERLLYSSYEIPIQPSSTIVLGAYIGAGKYSLGKHPPEWGFRLLAVVRYEDGSLVDFKTNSSWVWSPSSIVSENLYHGELYDAQLEQPGWARPGFVCGSRWSHPDAALPPPVAVLSPQLMPQIKETAILAPSLVNNTGEGLIFDMGVNTAGYVRVLLAPSPRGSTLTLSFGEVLDESGVVNPFGQTDSYTYSGTEAPGSTWSPKFVYHGFRYVHVSGIPAAVAGRCSVNASLCLVGVTVRSALEQSSRFEVSYTPTGHTLQAVHQAVLQTQRSNLHSIPTDCPQREKRGWMADAQWSAEEASINFDTPAFYANWLTSMADVQAKGCTRTAVWAEEPPYGSCCHPPKDPVHPTVFECSPMSNTSDTAGSLPDVVPMLWGNGGGRGWPAAPVWGSAVCVVPQTVLARYGDERLARDFLGVMEQYMDWLTRQARSAPGGVVPQLGLMGDWLALDPVCPGAVDSCLEHPGWTRGNPSTVFQYILNLHGMIQVSAALQDPDRARKYTALLNASTAAYHRLFFNQTSQSYGTQQTANLQPLFAGAVPASARTAAVEALVKGVMDSPTPGGGPHVSTGGVGSRWLLQTLTAVNRTDLALELAAQASWPSWGFFATHSPGTLWENWGGDDPQASHNHVFLGAGVDPWLFHHVAGIRTPSPRCAVGFGRGIVPIPLLSLDLGVEAPVALRVRGCNASVAVHGGRVSVAWEYFEQAGELHYTLGVPFGHNASVLFPGKLAQSKAVRGFAASEAGDEIVWRSEGAQASSHVSLAVAHGHHHLWVEYGVA
eukprot:TRINITY_DN12281_c0_g1_i10.p1 TRINITY_DN12281_c0_g1~~TRINITY_DN12281_c0_g1_i10.p1  ORF type:complete len:949 (+),score=157.40 TRINITY_DN12281_c0_g1_i10:285-3131(+)